MGVIQETWGFRVHGSAQLFTDSFGPCYCSLFTNLILKKTLHRQDLLTVFLHGMTYLAHRGEYDSHFKNIKSYIVQTYETINYNVMCQWCS